MIKVGVIHNVDYDKKIFSMRSRGNKIEYFYLQNSMMKKFQRYLKQGTYVSFDYADTMKKVLKIEAHQVNFFIRIMRKLGFRDEVYYDLSVIRSGVKDLFSNLDNIMFLDLEMTMQAFNSPENFKSEVIQAGFLITDKYGNDLEKVNYYIKPTLFPELNKKTMKFLSITNEDIDKGISFNEFYDLFKGYLEKYNNPSIIVWGKNDILALKICYEINKLEPITPNFINLLQLHKNYYNLKSDLGLFNAYKNYTGVDTYQEHDALADAYMTKNVFFEFKKTTEK